MTICPIKATKADNWIDPAMMVRVTAEPVNLIADRTLPASSEYVTEAETSLMYLARAAVDLDLVRISPKRPRTMDKLMSELEKVAADPARSLPRDMNPARAEPVAAAPDMSRVMLADPEDIVEVTI